jgi:hypothetical protein
MGGRRTDEEHGHDSYPSREGHGVNCVAEGVLALGLDGRLANRRGMGKDSY